LGNCYDPANPPDLILPPWLNLPATANYTIVGGYAPGSLGAYVDAQLTGIGPGFDIQDILYASWCADHLTTIYPGTTYNMDVYSSLYPTLLPAFAQLQAGKWSKINWLFNHLSWYPGYQWYDPQQVIWLFDSPAWGGGGESGVPNLTPLAQQMFNDANTYGAGYVPLPGGWATIIFISHGTLPGALSPTVQTMIIKIDP
jgi:hypothetical protein